MIAESLDIPMLIISKVKVGVSYNDDRNGVIVATHTVHGGTFIAINCQN